jgi:hypothetical protein
MSKENPVPAKSFAVLAVIAGLLFAPPVIERTDTTCGAVSSQVVNTMMARVTKETPLPTDEATRQFVQIRLRHELAEKIAPKLDLADKSWYECGARYWFNFVDPLPS